MLPNQNSSYRILHIISSLGRGGRERQLSVLTHYSHEEIEHYVLVFYKSKGSYLDEYRYENLFHKKNRFLRIFEIIRIIRGYKINLIHTWGNPETLYSLLPSWICRVPLLNGSIRHGIVLKTFNHQFRSFVLRRSKLIIGNSFAGFYANTINFNKSRHFVIYNGIEKKFFLPFNEAERKNFNIKNKLFDDNIIFSSIANFVPYKDYSTILYALSELPKEINFHYLVIGKGPMIDEIKRLISKLNLNDKVSILSDNPDIPYFLSIADIFIHSSLGEGCSNAILEASAAGLITVASDTGGTNEIINEWSFLFRYQDINDLRTQIINAVELFRRDKSVRNKIQEKTNNLFSVDVLIKNYSKVIYSIVNSD